MERVRVDGKQFAIGEERFDFRGVSYGTFEPRAGDGARVPDRDQLKRDLMAVNEAGFSVVRTYTAPPEDLLDLAADWDLHVLAGTFFPDWRYMLGASHRERRRIAHAAVREVRDVARRLSGNETVLAMSLGNEIPADVLRWVGTPYIAGVLDELVDVVRSEDEELLVTYGSFPTTEYLPLDGLDFLTFNVFLEHRDQLRPYLNRLHTLAGDRPLVLGELGLDSAGSAEGEAAQAAALDWMLEVATERGVAGTTLFSWTDEWWVGDAAVEGWHFGLTDANRQPKPSLAVAEKWNRRSVADLREEWPTISVVVCAYNAAATIDECVSHTCALDYPGLQVLVIDDGSTDDTATLARRYPRAEVHTIEHAGLSVARNAGYQLARGEIVAYLDSDAFPTSEWAYYLALAFDEVGVGGAGGPNVPPVSDPRGAQQVARAPGGPVHVLVTDDRAEHVPGCNMAFRRSVLEEVGGCDPVYTAAGDDVDLCWRVLDAGWQIAFHPAALVWHHRRTGIRPYLRQQRGYGRAEALVEARHPERFTERGTARWQGRIYNALLPSVGRQVIYRGLFGTAPFQSVYRAGGHGLDIAHQVGVPAAAALLVSAPLALLDPLLGAPAAAALAFLAVLAGIDLAAAQPPRRQRGGRLRFRAVVALLNLLQPLVRTWGRLSSAEAARHGLPDPGFLPGPVQRISRSVLLLPEDRPRARLVVALIGHLRRAGLRVVPGSGWDEHDARLHGSLFVNGHLVTSSHPVGSVQLRVRPRIKGQAVAAALVGSLALGLATAPTAALAGIVLILVEAARGVWRVGPRARRAIRASVA